MKPLLKGLCIGFLLGIPLLAAGIFFYNQMPVISEPEDQERPVEEPVAEAPEPEPAAYSTPYCKAASGRAVVFSSYRVLPF